MNGAFYPKIIPSDALAIAVLLFLLVEMFFPTVCITIYNFLNGVSGCPFCYISFCKGNCFAIARQRPKILSFVFP